MAAHTRTSNYFSGQGVLLVSNRTSGGLPEGFRHVGNVSALNLSFETTVFEHKESQTGARATDLRLTQEVKSQVNMTLESIDNDNLELALYGTGSTVASGTVSNEVIVAKLGYIHGLRHIKVSSVVVTNSAGTTTYVLDDNYRENLDAGSLYIMTTDEQTAASAVASITDGQTIHVDYSYAAQFEVDALTTSAPEKYLRFEGLNTADNSKPMVVEVFKFRPDPLQEFGLINEEIAQIQIAGSALQDGTKLTGSQYFRQMAMV